MTSDQDVADLIAKTQAAFGDRIDILVHVTGGLVARKTLLEMDVDHWNTVMDLNATSFLRAAKGVVPNMTNGGAIVALASQAGRDGGGPGAVAYGASKGAVMTMTRGLAKELGPNIRVNSVCPGMIDTDFHNIHTPDAGRRGFEAAAPLKRQGTIEDCCGVVEFLTTDLSAYVTGRVILIDGGMLH